ncbi:AbrB/MazE/SpoVT family DNA-binding domain-containing protein [Natrinema versiforme]|uniref:AbrB/MazE/SpoVT family DNA-binding domain-containing protein n=2 Tax=root TaxID=1 RepID=A0A4P8WNC3_9EURY|nr:AbrB/MazE/SpoVT family DNA-binding domain-containing protein [Natrinema versiforme]YP_010772671.1 AbrB/MazE/SpoVT family DNA-binding domain-containing protein [Natrinema versiforme icosahedral virus 1]QCS45119.1 AbrB/MazE/SpoVT family DNA-binding domain-containing protein [Natrinema versiforme]DAC85255.1 TPA_asm: AbrB/MazE/SpoVT family DNA-binding domain-containing protein [Natrinema versiforme icosahedral virus 1]
MSVRVDTESNEFVDERDVRTSGGSTVITIPPEILKQSGLEPGDPVEFRVGFDEEGMIRLEQKEDDEA